MMGRRARCIDRAVDDLVGYTQDFGAFLSGANPNMPRSAVADLVKRHVLTLKAIDARAANDSVPRLHGRAQRRGPHMQMIADPPAEAIAQQLPDRF